MRLFLLGGMMLALVSTGCAFTCLPSTTTTTRQSTFLWDTPQLPSNEFSRPLNTDRLLKTSSGRRRAQRDYQTTIQAEPEECRALAERFGLRDLSSLSADLAMRPTGQYSTNSGGILTVQVQGTIEAHLTQTCVRTNEDFKVDVEIPLFAVVKPIMHAFMKEDEELIRKAISKPKKDGGRVKSDRLNNMNDLVELQSTLDRMEVEDEDMIEDESIYSLSTGLLDVGELVAQTFWLSLDQYPKKPGTGPIEMSISG